MQKFLKLAHDDNRKFFTSELNLRNVSRSILKNGNLVCRATNNPELRPVRAIVKLVKFGEYCKLFVIVFIFILGFSSFSEKLLSGIFNNNKHNLQYYVDLVND